MRDITWWENDTLNLHFEQVSHFNTISIIILMNGYNVSRQGAGR